MSFSVREVSSSTLLSVAYNTAAQQMVIGFKTGSIYLYEGVPPGLHAELMSSPSIGSAYHRLIKKPATFQGRRLSDEEWADLQRPQPAIEVRPIEFGGGSPFIWRSGPAWPHAAHR
jgi:hypothetical protein